MDRLDKAIADTAYIFDSLMALRNILNTGDCNVCARKIGCEYKPPAGQMVRYNCPFYKADTSKEMQRLERAIEIIDKYKIESEENNV